MSEDDRAFWMQYFRDRVSYIQSDGRGRFIEHADTLLKWAREGDAAAWEKLHELAMLSAMDGTGCPYLRSFAIEVYSGMLPRPVQRGQPSKRARDRRIRQIITDAVGDPPFLRIEEADDMLAEVLGMTDGAVQKARLRGK